ncbi:uncharacterized protein RAG0_07358 [Rhynchosporium agropyri]|uniref:Uncharacterized protein n=1 Tax=Rhynchosporium agropyri TaxID=914238 RepID=A0A1E1KLA1_9HELO|nr:uncharacterized protein RAG0_07358 [Rhynchosporium agropyri]
MGEEEASKLEGELTDIDKGKGTRRQGEENYGIFYSQDQAF